MMPQLFIFCALDCEAKPLVRFYHLKKQAKMRAFSIYKNNNIVLTITGVGKVAMAGAVSYTLALFLEEPFPVLINVGIAGHKTHTIGHLLLAMKIVDQESGKKFYPQLLGINRIDCCELKTISAPLTTYGSDCLYDMEASAFYEIAVRFSTSELIHCYKIVSDNEQSSINKIQAKLVIEWITDQTFAIDKEITNLLELSQSIAPVEIDEYYMAIKKWHFTVSGQIRLKSLLKRWHVLSGDNWLNNNNTSFNRSKDVLKKLEADIKLLEVHL